MSQIAINPDDASLAAGLLDRVFRWQSRVHGVSMCRVLCAIQDTMGAMHLIVERPVFDSMTIESLPLARASELVTESRATMYHHDAGGGEPYVNGYGREWVAALPGRMWIADGVTVYSADGKHRPLSDDDLLALGIKRVHGPPPNPLAWAVESRVVWCSACGEDVPEEGEDVGPCSCCHEDHHMHVGDLIAVTDEDECSLDASGVYRVQEIPFMSRWIMGGCLWPSALHRVADLPDDVDTQGYAAGPVCRDCARRILADRGLDHLGLEWAADPEAMLDERREALLEAIRDRVDVWIDGYPEQRAGRVHEWFAAKLGQRFGVTASEMGRLCEEAGFA